MRSQKQELQCHVLIVLIVCVMAACGGPDIADGTIACSPTQECPPNFACGFDGQCYVASTFACDNGIVDPGESCDPMVLCPDSCNDGNACTKDALLGAAESCDVTCKYAVIVNCADGDGCCPANCGPGNDSDCSQTCGDGELDTGETCDPQTSCPEECADGAACTLDVLTGSAGNCNVSCTFEPISDCLGGDGCCPAGCGPGTDDDCSDTCGNNKIDPGETCDPPSSCPRNCDDSIDCTLDTLIGSPDACTSECLNQPIAQCSNNDNCCPNGCNIEIDNDCSSSCGDDVIDPDEGETCDPPDTCPTSCDDDDVCTTDDLTGSADSCSSECSHRTITECVSGDLCCPANCLGIDTDCGDGCGDGGPVTADCGVIDAGPQLSDGGILPPV